MTYRDRDTLGADNSVRKAHYGSDRQPWDDIVDQGWGPAFAAGNVLKYMRRQKDPEHSIQSAKWYFDRLVSNSDRKEWLDELNRLIRLLTADELCLLYTWCAP